MRQWQSLDQLADLLDAHAAKRETVTIRSDTARMLAELSRTCRPPASGPERHFNVDLYSSGSCIYELDKGDNIVAIVAWARSTVIAHAAFDALKAAQPRNRYVQRRRSWVERT